MKRSSLSLFVGIVVSLVLFWLMQAMITNNQQPMKTAKSLQITEFIKLKTLEKKVEKKRKLPQELPAPPPPPPEEPEKPTKAQALPEMEIPDLAMPEPEVLTNTDVQLAEAPKPLPKMIAIPKIQSKQKVVVKKRPKKELKKTPKKPKKKIKSRPKKVSKKLKSVKKVKQKNKSRPKKVSKKLKSVKKVTKKSSKKTKKSKKSSKPKRSRRDEMMAELRAIKNSMKKVKQIKRKKAAKKKAKNKARKKSKTTQANSKSSSGVKGGNSAAKVLSRARPKYPRRAMRNGKEGWVKVSFTVTPSGSISGASVVGSSSSVFNSAALSAVRRFRVKPKKVNGRAVSQRMTQTIRFKLP